MSDSSHSNDASTSFLLSAEPSSAALPASFLLTKISNVEFSSLNAKKDSLVSTINEKLNNDPEYFGDAADQVVSFVHEISCDHFEFKKEPWHNISIGVNDRAPSDVSEYLLRVGGEKDKSPFAVINALYDAGLHFELDRFVARGVFNQAPPNENVSINFAVETILDPRFQEMMESVRGNHPPDKIVIEVLEHDVPDMDVFKSQRQLLCLGSMEQAGYRFAIDDFRPYSSQGHWDRLEKFKGHVCAVKLDLEWLKKAGAQELGKVCDHLRKVCGDDVLLVAEGIKTPEYAAMLYDKFRIQAVQGWRLPEDTSVHARAFLNDVEPEKDSAIKIYDPVLAL